MKTIAFIKIGSNSGINALTLRMLEREFPGFSIETIDLWKDLIRYRSLSGLYHAVREFGPRVLRGNYGTAALRTHDSFSRARSSLRRRCADRSYAFTFQTQSLFDFSLPGTPHFVYTDGTHLSLLPQLETSGVPPAARRRGTACHEAAMSIIADYARRPSKIALEKEVFANATLVFTRNRDVTRTIVEQYGCPAGKVACVYSGSHLDPAAFPADPGRFRKKNILFVGMEWERKGGPELLAAFEEVRRAHPDATLTVVGCSPEVRIPGCSVAGRLSLEEVGPYYAAASVVCVPSRMEPFGNVFVEALHFGLPVVSTRVGALPDMVADGENGYLVGPGDPGRLAAALIDLLSHPEKCRVFGERGRALAIERYTWEKTGAAVRENILKHVGTGTVPGGS